MENTDETVDDATNLRAHALTIFGALIDAADIALDIALRRLDALVAVTASFLEMLRVMPVELVAAAAIDFDIARRIVALAVDETDLTTPTAFTWLTATVQAASSSTVYCVPPAACGCRPSDTKPRGATPTSI